MITQAADDARLDAKLIAAFCHVESGGGIYKTRLEPNFKYLVTPDEFAKLLNITVATETTLQQMSWGLMQIMGGTARWLGYRGDLPDLCDPKKNLYWSCQYLAKLTTAHKSNLEDVIASYNAGSPKRDEKGLYANQKYVNKVVGYYRELLTGHTILN